MRYADLNWKEWSLQLTVTTPTSDKVGESGKEIASSQRMSLTPVSQSVCLQSYGYQEGHKPQVNWIEIYERRLTDSDGTIGPGKFQELNGSVRLLVTPYNVPQEEEYQKIGRSVLAVAQENGIRAIITTTNFKLPVCMIMTWASNLGGSRVIGFTGIDE